ncbi:hypothetical protein Nepgr_031857 [Nepenthes gracilis]|uniref:Macrophage migration inhibitory factor n=1 Tax=Nepenthes gracilis TaxID=150966 RepID=A0AAD3Y7F7_NEPGR|nr:hypothetical protein Nepgr_031857 [Nepenthes gracilis]
MPALYISTNVNLDGRDLQPVFSNAITALASIIGRPEKNVMVVVKGSVAISFYGTEEPAAFAELLSMGGINGDVKRKLISTIGAILDRHLSIPTTRFFCHVVDVKSYSKL